MAFFREPLSASLRRVAAPLALGATALAAASLAGSPAHAEPVTCLSPDPSVWPAASKPYFMIIVDNSGSMGTAIAGGANSCGYQHNRIGDARCAVKNTVQAYAGEVNFGLATYAWRETGCSNATCGVCDQTTGCFAQCTAEYGPNDDIACGSITSDPGFYGGVPPIHNGAYVVSRMLQDHYWVSPPDASNVPAIVGLVDNNCGNGEIGADSNTPLGGSLYNMKQYFSGTYVDPFTSLVVPTPIGPANFGGQPAERSCRSINIILITDGDETCDGYIDSGTYPTIQNGELLAALEAQSLLNPGVTVSGQTFPIKTYVIGFVGATKAALDNIASFGGTGSSYSTANEQQLAQALANIISGSTKPETCDNKDNNCNGCTDEGFTHYCDVQAGGCCTWKTPAQKAACGATACACCNATNAAERTTCLTNFTATITAANPKGDQSLLPCTTAAQAALPASWLCFDPGEKCDNVDNNCVAGTDEGVVKCGNPLHCPSTEVCDGIDNDCDGLIDEGCAQVCNASPEICDGCDNDCSGVTDNGVAPIPCGPTGPGEPANCQGFLVCKPGVVVTPGGCAPGGGFNACNNSPQVEICDNLDNNCNGIIDDNIPSIPCVPAGQPGNLVYGGTSQCKKGSTVCVNGVTQCQGFIGPSVEVCDGIDNDCDGQVDEAPLPGVGVTCGINQPPCVPGTTACVNGAIVCQGGVGPTPEKCDGIDNNCNGVIDDAPLADAPLPGQNGCWIGGGNCCSFPAQNPTLFWCAPPGANCNNAGSLLAPCNVGTLACQGGAWSCKNPKPPGTEVCDGVDNDCDGQIDEAPLPGVGQSCGSANPPCMQGIKACVAGVITCQGGVDPTPEICDGIDNDCNGVIDDGIAIGSTCTIAYDMNMYPGDRTKGPCKPGVLQCDGNGNTVCLGGVGPTPEVCDGIDNDCDGQIDEVGNPPDGINGTQNPFPPPQASVGDPCGSTMGECKQGVYACVNGTFACVGGQSSVAETCDCKDNDCDGQVDNPNGGMAICSPGKDCVSSTFGCQCAEPCDKTKEFPCPGGQTCQQVTSSQTGMVLGDYCVSDPCGDCAGKTVKDPVSNSVICAPVGAAPDPATCIAPPVCECKGQSGCKDPCFGVVCAGGTVCKRSGQGAGTCIVDSCFANPCTCGKVCNLGTCIDDPCVGANCKPNEECKPTADFLGFTCISPCADANCAAGQLCVDGMCVDGCAPACAANEVCDTSTMPPACVPDKCNPSPCTDGSCCNPVTGSCGNCPCEGVHCPSGQHCDKDECVGGGTGGADGGPSTSSSSGGGSATGAGGASSGTGGTEPGIWGLATGGGGCSCEVGPGLVSRLGGGKWALAALALIALRRRRRARRGAGEEVAS